MIIIYKGQDLDVHRTIFPVLLAKQCFSCKRWYRFERMWRFLRRKQDNIWCYICFECAKDKIEVSNKIKVAIKSRRPPTPTPPKPIYLNPPLH